MTKAKLNKYLFNLCVVLTVLSVALSDAGRDFLVSSWFQWRFGNSISKEKDCRVLPSQVHQIKEPKNQGEANRYVLRTDSDFGNVHLLLYYPVRDPYVFGTTFSARLTDASTPKVTVFRIDSSLSDRAFAAYNVESKALVLGENLETTFFIAGALERCDAENVPK